MWNWTTSMEWFRLKPITYTNCYGEQDEGVDITDDQHIGENDATYLRLPPSEKGYMIMISRKQKMHWVIDDRNCQTEW